ncbi:trypsin-like peptidase [Dyadobacter jejuensis]|uniref:Trypsin-like peptidase n=1 Tax=Dyadobacter jejuensis TaxID=1082580 RepID=A0A316AIY9_9BACT|nr:trypsin-like peptidase domain-containing protein [Dyadobacter jejuensis]PWJ56944.1 trypsin-like peptidase [Dyadobacter jejuensis]
MFVAAIDRVDKFTRPIHFIARYYKGTDIVPGTATLFFVNEEGFAITCRHVAQQILHANSIYENFLRFNAALKKFHNDPGLQHQRSLLEGRYKINAESVIRIMFNFIQCVSSYKSLSISLHPTQDLAIIQFKDFDQMLYRGHATFLKDSSAIKPGKYLCRLGYPFPEFTNYQYNKVRNDIEWKNEGRQNSPSFPIDGIVTRRIADGNEITGIEMSTPGLKGQSGGPLFDTHGLIYGMQSSTRHLHLGFDQINREVTSDGQRKRVSNYPFLNVGQCVHVDIIKQFLKDKGVQFFEDNP